MSDSESPAGHYAGLRRPGRRSLVALLSAAVLATCTTDRPTGPGAGGRGYLSIRPVFTSPANLAAFGFTIDSVRVAAIRPVSDTVVDTTVFFDPTSATLKLSLSVPLQTSPEKFFVLLQLRAGAQLLYSGMDTTLVSLGAPDTTSSASITLKYVGPGAGLTSISIAPRDSVVTLLGTKQFRVSADSNGKAIPSFFVNWSTSDAVAAPIDSTGLLHAPAARAGVYVRAVTPDGVHDSTRVTFIPAPTTVTAVSGDGQSGVVGARLPLPLRARVSAADNLGVKGIAVQFLALTGGGSVRDPVVITDSLGFAEDSATLGTLAGAASFQASVTGLTAATFAATATAGAISPAQSVVTVSAPTLASGSAATLTLQAKDAFGNTLTSGGAIVAFTATGGTSSGAIGATTDHGDGTYTATFTGVLAGTATTIGATVNGSPVTTTLPTVTVTAGVASPATSIVSVSGASVASGGAVTLTLQTKDAAGNGVTTGGATVLFSRSGGTSTGTIGATADQGDGSYTATFTGVLAGTATTIGASINGAAVTTLLPTVTVTAGAISAAASVVTSSSGTVAAGAGATLTLQAKDAAGNILTTGGATVIFAATGGTSTGTITPTPATDNGNGTYTSTFIGALAGTATTINASVNGTAVTSTLPTVTVVPGAISAATSLVQVSAGTVASGTSVTLTLRAKDAANNSLASGGAVVLFTSSGGTSTGAIGTTTDNGDGSYTAVFTGVIAGTPTTVGATINGTAVTTALPVITVGPGAISAATSVLTTTSGTIAAGASATLTLQAKDAAGNNLTSGGAIVTFVPSGGTSTGTIGTTSDFGNGTYATVFTGVVAGSATTIHATVNGTSTTSAVPIIVVAGNSATAQSVVTASAATVAAGGTVTLTLQARDSLGNNVPTGGLTVVFAQSGGSSTGLIAPSPATDNGNGTYTATFTGALAGTATTIGATMNGAAVTSTLPTITVTPGAISPSTSIVQVSAASVASGSSVTVSLRAKDAAGNNLLTGGASVAFTAVGGTSTGSIGAPADLGDGTYAATFTAVLAGTATTIGATINGSPVTTTLPTVTVTAGAASPATSIVTVSSGTVLSGTSVTLTLQAKDAAGNAVATGGATVLFNASGGTSTGSILPSPATDNGNGTYTASFTGVLAGTALTIGATINGSAVSSTLPTITVTPGTISTATSLVTVSAATVASGDSATLRLQAKDAAGNNLTTGGATVVFAASGGTSTGIIGATVDLGSGTYTAKFTAVLAGTATTIGATIGGSPVTSPLPTITAAPGAISTATSVVTVSDSVVPAGAPDTLFLRAKDAAGNLLTTGGALVAFTQTAGIGVSAGSISPTTDPGTGLYHAIFTGGTAGTPTTIGATISGIGVSSTPLPTIRVSVTTHTADITGDSTWTAAASPHIVNGYLRIRNGATLTIQPGALVKFDAGSGLQVGDTTLGQSGRLVLDGTGPGITLTANTASPAPGFWKGIEVQRNLALTTWRRALIEWAGGTRAPFGGVAAEACVLFVNRSGAEVDLDSVRIRQCTHAGIHHFGGLTHVHRSEIDTVSGSAIHADLDARLELDSTVLRGAANDGLEIPSPLVTLLPSSGNAVFGSGILAMSIQGAQLPGMLRQDTIGGNAANIIEVVAGAPVDTSFTLFRQPRGLVFGNDYDYRISGLLTVSGPLGPQVTLDSNLVVRFLGQSGLVIGDSSGTGTARIRSLGTGPANEPRLTSIDTPGSPGEWVGLEIGRVAAADTLKHVHIEFAGDSLLGRTVHRAGLWIRNASASPVVVDSVTVISSGSTTALDNSGGFVVTAAGGGVEIRHSLADNNAGYGFALGATAKLIGNTATTNFAGLLASDNGLRFTAADSITGNTFTSNGTYPAEFRAGVLPGLYANSVAGNGRDTLLLKGGSLSLSATLPKAPGVPWRVTQAVQVDSDAVLTLASRDTVLFDDSAGIFVGDSAPAALRALSSGGPVLLSATPGHALWFGLRFGGLSQPDTLMNVVIEKAGVIPGGCPISCEVQGLPIVASVSYANSTPHPLVLDSVTVRQATVYAVASQPSGGGTVSITHSQFYDNPNANAFYASTGLALSIDSSDIYHYRRNFGDAVILNNFSTDSVTARHNWWGDVSGPGVATAISSQGDSIGRALLYEYYYRVAYQPFATVPHFAVNGPVATLVGTPDSLLPPVQTGSQMPDSVRVRALDALGRGLVGQSVSWSVTAANGTLTFPLNATDAGGRAGAHWTVGTVAKTDSAKATSGAASANVYVDVVAGFTASHAWQLLPSRTQGVVSADSLTVTFTSTVRTGVVVTHARDANGNVTQPSAVFFEDLPGIGSEPYGIVDSTKADTIFFHATVASPATFQLHALYQGVSAQLEDSVFITMNAAAKGMRINQDTAQFSSVCPSPPGNAACSRQFLVELLDSAGAPLPPTDVFHFQWAKVGTGSAVTLDSVRGVMGDVAFVTARADGPDTLVAQQTLGPALTPSADTLSIVVQQVASQILVNPSVLQVGLGDTVTFTGTVVDLGGTAVANAPSVRWRVDPPFGPFVTFIDTTVVGQAKVRIDSMYRFSSSPEVAVTAYAERSPGDTLTAPGIATNPIVVSVSGQGTSPFAAAVNPLTGNVYVVNRTNPGLVQVFDSTPKQVATIQVDLFPNGIAVWPSANRVYVVNGTSETASIIDGSTNTVIASNLPVGPTSGAVAVDTVLGAAFVAGKYCADFPATCSTPYVKMIGGTSIVDSIQLPADARGLAVQYNPTGEMLFVSMANDTMVVIDLEQKAIVDTIAFPAGSFLTGVAVNSITKRVYVAEYSASQIGVVDGTPGVDTLFTNTYLPVNNPNFVSVDEKRNLAYSAASSNTLVLAIDGATNTVFEDYIVGNSGDFPQDAAVNAADGRVYIPHNFALTLFKFFTH